jgi:hypothetical protein
VVFLNSSRPAIFRGKVKKEQEKLRNKKLSKSMIKLIFKNNTMIRILAIELLKTSLLLIF